MFSDPKMIGGFLTAHCRKFTHQGTKAVFALSGPVLRRFRVTVGLALPLVLSACGGGGGSAAPPPPPPVVTLSSIAVTATATTVTAGQTQQFTATAKYSDGSTKDVTSTATWASSATAIATVAPGGLATSLITGITTISASVSNVSGTTQLTVDMPVPSSWTAKGVDFGLKKRCIRTVSPSQANFYTDNTDCPGGSYPTSGYWTTAVETEIPGALCTGVVDQSFPINGVNSPVSETWTGNSSAGYSLDLKTDFTNTTNPCTPKTWTWVPLMDNWAGGGPLPPPNHLVTQFNATFTRSLPAGSGATRAMAGVGAQWDISLNGSTVLATFEVEVNFYTDQPAWGVQPGQPPDVIAFRTNTAATPPFYYVDLDGTKLFAPISAQLSTPTQITVNWAAVLQHLMDEGLLPPPVNGWASSNAATSATYGASEVGNFTNANGGPVTDLVLSNYQEGFF